MDFKILNQIVKDKLGNSLKEEDKQSISNLNNIPLKLIENSRKIENELIIEPYLSFYVTPDNNKYLRTFIRRVITNREEASTWNKGRALIADSSLMDQLTKEKEEIFGYDSAEFKTIIRPNFVAWSQGSDFGGMFVFCEPDADYKSSTPPGYSLISLKDVDLIEVEQKQVTIQFRRWLASRMAAYLKHKNQLETFNSTGVLEELVSRDQWTNDAIKACEGLLKERENYKWKENDIPGFCGENSYYE